jgi:hypothetical protein
MKIWKEFGSSHSGNVSVIGTFTDNENANKAFEMVKDFTLGEWEERHASVKEFLEIWSEKFHPDLKYSSINATDYSLGVDNDPDVEIIGNKIKISRIRSQNVGGIVKLMLFAGAKNTDVTNNNL